MFEVNESVIVNDGKYYLAKILAIDKKEDGSNRFFVHYNGWGSKYDQWISEDSINKDNEVNRALMKYKNRSEEGAYKQHSILDEIIQYYDYPNKSKLPYQLHQLLVIDWFMVTQRNHFVPLPRYPNIKQILQLYNQSVKENEDIDLSNATELIEGILYYTNVAADTVLLYPSEQAQFNAVQEKKCTNICEVLGAEHLLRLLFQLPALYSASDYSEKDNETIRLSIGSLLSFLSKHTEFFLEQSQYVEEEKSLVDLTCHCLL